MVGNDLEMSEVLRCTLFRINKRTLTIPLAKVIHCGGKGAFLLPFLLDGGRESVECIATRELRDLRGTTLLHYNLCE